MSRLSSDLEKQLRLNQEQLLEYANLSSSSSVSSAKAPMDFSSKSPEMKGTSGSMRESEENIHSSKGDDIHTIEDVEKIFAKTGLELSEVCNARIRYNESLLDYFQSQNKNEIIELYIKRNFGEKVYKCFKINKGPVLLCPGKETIRTMEKYAQAFVQKDIIYYKKIIELLESAEADKIYLLLRQAINQRFVFKKNQNEHNEFVDFATEREIYKKMLNKIKPYISPYLIMMKEKKFFSFKTFEEISNLRSLGNSIFVVELAAIVKELLGKQLSEVLDYLNEIKTPKLGIAIAGCDEPEIKKFEKILISEKDKCQKLVTMLEKGLDLSSRVESGEIDFDLAILQKYEGIKKYIIVFKNGSEKMREAFEELKDYYSLGYNNRKLLLQSCTIIDEAVRYLRSKKASLEKFQDTLEKQQYLQKLMGIQEKAERICSSIDQQGVFKPLDDRGLPSETAVISGKAIHVFSEQVQKIHEEVESLKNTQFYSAASKSSASAITQSTPSDNKPQSARTFLGEDFEPKKLADKVSKIQQIILSSKEYLNKERLKKVSEGLSKNDKAMREERIRKMRLHENHNIVLKFEAFYSGNLSHDSLMKLISALQDAGENIQVRENGSSHYSICISGTFDYIDDGSQYDFTETGHSWHVQAQKLKKRGTDNLPKHICERLQACFTRAGYTKEVLGLGRDSASLHP